MPRKSTSSTSAGDTTISLPSNAEAVPGPTPDGDTSRLSVATDDASTSTKAKVNGKAAGKDDADSVGVDDLLLPRTLTSRLARGILPANTSIQKDALLALTKAATVFISYLAHNANELTPKKTIGPQDVLKAIQEIEMGGVMALGQVGGGRLERELEVFETVVRGKRKGYREKVKARESGGSNLNERRGSGEMDEGEGVERESKRARFEDGEGDGEQRDGRGNKGAANDRTPSSSSHQPQHQHQQQHSVTVALPPPAPTTNGATPHLPNNDTIPDDDDPGDDNDENAEDGDANDQDDEEEEDDEAEEEDEEEEEEDDDEKQPPPEDEMDGYGPDDQLRHDMKGESEDEDEDDEDGSRDGSD